MPWCVIIGCRNNLKATKQAGKGISFHIIPKNSQRRSAWINALNLPSKLNADSSYVCSEHFDPDDYECNSLKEELLNTKFKRQLKRTAIPSINIPKYSEEELLNIPINHLDSQNPNETTNTCNKSAFPIKQLTSNAIPTLKCELIIDNKSVEASERKKLVDKLLADYDEHQKNGSHLNNVITEQPNFFSPKINSNAKLSEKLKLIKAINNSEKYCPPKKRKLSKSTKSNTYNVEQPIFNNAPQNKDQVIHVSAVKGGLMLHTLPQASNELKSSVSIKCEPYETEEIIIVTKDEANHVNLSSYKEQHKEKNTEIIVVTNMKEGEDNSRSIESLPKNSSIQMYNNINSMSMEQNQLANNGIDTPSYSAKVPLGEEKGCQVSIPCGGCENRSLKINKLLRERTRLTKNLNQNGTWRDPDEINTLKKMNGVLSLLLMQCVGKKSSKKLSSIRVDSVQKSIERVNRDWSMQDTSEALSQALSVNAYDEFARNFQIINEM